jgi:hypothetical protein
MHGGNLKTGKGETWKANSDALNDRGHRGAQRKPEKRVKAKPGKQIPMLLTTEDTEVHGAKPWRANSDKS